MDQVAGSVEEDLAALDDAALIAELAELERRSRSTYAAMARRVAALEARRAHRADGHASMAGWLRAELRWSSHQVTAMRRTARLLADLPSLGEALASSEIGVAQVQALGRARGNPRCGDQLADSEALWLDLARRLDFEAFALCLRRWELLADVDGAHRDAEASHANRFLSLRQYDGVGLLEGQGSAIDAAEFVEIHRRYVEAEFAADWAATVAQHGDAACGELMPRTDAQRDWDALMAIVRDAASTPADAQPPEPTLNIVIDQATFDATLVRMGLMPDPSAPSAPPDASDEPTPTLVPWDRRRCETIDGRLLDPLQAVLAGIHGHIRRVVFSTSGVVTDLGRRRRLFTGAARDAVRVLTGGCVWPGCTQPASRCETDHLTEWHRNGPTNPGNGGLACPRHNRHRNHGFRVWRDPGGAWHTYRPDGTELGATLAHSPPAA